MLDNHNETVIPLKKDLDPLQRKYVILGGGTAGWLTALFIKKTFPDSNVTVIQSKVLGIIGVGEATTTHIVSFLRSLDIDPLDVIRKTSGTIKNGISFENWNGDGKKYFHAFADRIVDFYIPNIFDTECADFYLKNLIQKKLPQEEYVYQSKLAANNRVDIDKTAWAIHFDSTKFAEYLEEVGKLRNIQIIEEDYTHCRQDDYGNIRELYLKNGKSVNCDFVFDCSGFSRLLIGEVYKGKWNSFSNHLPMKKGIPFWLNQEDEIKSYSTATAMKYGWMWQIPLQHRIGAGYIFDSDYINEDQALTEAEEHLGLKCKVNKIIPFEAGRFDNFWIKNCIAIGLSSHFLEPLEATSIWMSIFQLNTLRQFLNELTNQNQNSISKYNKVVTDNVDDSMTFIYLHYITKRNDSDFWKNFKNNTVIPKKLQDIFHLIKEGNLRSYDTPLNSFSLTSYLFVCGGLDMFENLINIGEYENIVPSPPLYKEIINNQYLKSQKHRDFLNGLNYDR
jgi:tryptophan 7-halogenase